MPSPAGDMGTFLNTAGACVAPLSPTTAALGLFLAWVVATSSRAIIGEYAKRFWFRAAWRDAVETSKARLQSLAEAIDGERAVHEATVDLAEHLIVERDRLLEENYRLRRLVKSSVGTNDNTFDPPPGGSGTKAA